MSYGHLKSNESIEKMFRGVTVRALAFLVLFLNPAFAQEKRSAVIVNQTDEKITRVSAYPSYADREVNWVELRMLQSKDMLNGEGIENGKKAIINIDRRECAFNIDVHFLNYVVNYRNVDLCSSVSLENEIAVRVNLRRISVKNSTSLKMVSIQITQFPDERDYDYEETKDGDWSTRSFRFESGPLDSGLATNLYLPGMDCNASLTAYFEDKTIEYLGFRDICDHQEVEFSSPHPPFNNTSLPMPPPPFLPFNDGVWWVLYKDLVYEVGDSGQKIVVPKGFVTDFASVPGTLWSFKGPTGPYSLAAVVHDYLYWTQQCTKDQADDVFRYAMRESRVNRFIEVVFHWAVSVAGHAAWKRNQQERLAGVPRIIDAELPPNTRWEEFRKTLSKSKNEASFTQASFCGAATELLSK